MEREEKAPQRPARGRRRMSRDERRGQLLAAAIEIAARRDLERVPVAELAAAAGVSEGLLFHYFPTKSALVLAVVEDAAASLAADLSSVPPGPAATRLAAGLDAYLDHLERQPNSWRVLLHGSDDPAVAQALARVEGTSQGLLMETLGIRQPSAVLSTAVRAFLAYERAACLHWLDDGRQLPRDQLAALLSGAFLGSLQAVSADPVVAQALAALQLVDGSTSPSTP